MSIKHLHHNWSGPDNSQLTAKQFSFRLPVHIAAKLAALCELYPSRNRTQIVADLLDHAMNLLEAELPMELGSPAFDDGKASPDKGPFHCSGMRAKFRDRANQIYEAYEMEQGIQQPGQLYQPLLVTKSMIEQQGRSK
jgi:hypothetical protein